MTEPVIGLATLRIAAAVLVAFGGALFVYLGLDGLGWVVGRLVANRRQSWRNLQRYSLRGEQPEKLTQDQVYGAAQYNWPLLCLVTGAGGLLVSWALYGQQPGPGMFAGVAAAGLPLLQRRYLILSAQRQIKHQVRTFITDLRLGLQIEGSLGPTLDRLAQAGGEGILYERLRFHTETRLRANMTPVDVVRRLADELYSRELKELIVRLQAAQRGVETYERALATAAEEIVAQMTAEAEQSIEGATTRLMVPMLFLLTAPLLVLALYPVFSRIIEGLTGTGLF